MNGDERDRATADSQSPPADHAVHAVNDAAYVLGGLGQADLIAFEEHLAHCAVCQVAVAELRELTPLLSSVSISDLDDLTSEQPPSTLLPRLLSEVHARRRRSWRMAAISFAAACMLAVLVFGGAHHWTDSHRPAAMAMQQVGPNTGQVHGTITLTGSNNDTRIQLTCGYHAAAGIDYPSGLPSYQVVVYNRLGQMRELGGWIPQPNEDIQIDRASPWSRHDLSKIEVSTAQGIPVLVLNL